MFFEDRYPDLFEAILEVQPAYDSVNNEWINQLFSIVNKDKHEEEVVESEECISLAKTAVPRVARLVQVSAKTWDTGLYD